VADPFAASSSSGSGSPGSDRGVYELLQPLSLGGVHARDSTSPSDPGYYHRQRVVSVAEIPAGALQGAPFVCHPTHDLGWDRYRDDDLSLHPVNGQETFQARCAEAVASSWRMVLARGLSRRVASLSNRDLRRLSNRELGRLVSPFGWFILDPGPVWLFEMVNRPEHELRILWDGRRQSGKELRQLGLLAAYERVRAEAERRADREEQRRWPEVRQQHARTRAWVRQRRLSHLRRRPLAGQPHRTLVRTREVRAPRRVARVGSGSRGDPSRSSDDDPDPAGVAACRLEAAA
jgi:hypothetical protein